MKWTRVGVLVLALTLGLCAPGGTLLALPESTPPLPLEEELVLGLDEEPALGDIASVSIGPDGDIYVLDRGYKVVQRYNAQGEHLAEFGREGEGPGEFFNPRCLAVRQDGLVVVAGTSIWITVFEPGGKPRQSIQRRFNSFVGHAVFAGDGTLYVTSLDRETDTVIQPFRGDALEEGDSFGRLMDETEEKPRNPQEDVMRRARAAGPLAFATDGNLLYSPMVPQRIDVLTPQGELLSSNPARRDESRMPIVETSEGAMTVRVPTSCTALVPFPDGRYLTVLWQWLDAPQDEGEGWPSEAHVDLYGPDHARLATWTVPNGLGVRTGDAQGRLYIAESRENADGDEVPVLVRYRFKEPPGGN